MIIAVTGSRGQVVQAICERSRLRGERVVSFGRPRIDLLNPASIFAEFASVKPDVIVNAAAYTSVDAAESDSVVARQINVVGARAVAQAAERLGVPIIHLSTDFVFDGLMNRPYVEDDFTAPLNVYGVTKREGELAVIGACASHVILRLSWVYSPFGKNFALTMLKLGRQERVIRVVGDQHGGPSNAFDIADGILAIAQNILASPGDRSLNGLFHMTAAGATSWADFAKQIFDFSRKFGLPPVDVHAILSSDYMTAARRPQNSRLDCSKLARTHGVQLPHWRHSLEAGIERLIAANTN